MKNKVTIINRYLLICGMIVSGVWLGSDFSWEPITVLLFSLAGFISTDVFLSRKTNTHDKDLFNLFLTELPYDGSIKFIDEFNMAGWSFNRKELNQLQYFLIKWRAPEYRFLDKKLEKLRSELFKKINAYLSFLAVNTWVINSNFEFSSVPPEWEDEQPERFHEVVKKLHDSAGEIVKLHDDFVSLGIIKGLNQSNFIPITPTPPRDHTNEALETDSHQ